jgi:sugar phosphate isomerase/epimerase
MFKYGVQVSVDEVSERTPVVLRGEFEKVASIAHSTGYDGIELFMHTPGQKDPHIFKKIADAYNLTITCICTGMEYGIHGLNLTSDDKTIREKAVKKLKEHIDFADITKSFVCIGTMRGQIPNSNLRQTHYQRLASCLAELNAYAKNKNVQLVVENNPQYVSNYLNTIYEVGSFVKKLNLSNVGLHLDTHCISMEDKDIEDVKDFADILKYFHYSDSNRGYPGSNNFNFLKMTKSLMEINYQGFITLECQPYPTEEECARRGLAYVKAIEAAAKIELLDLKDSIFK